MKYISLLENKWGKFTKTGHYYVNGRMPFISPQARLNVFFEPLNDEELDNIEKMFDCKLPCVLREFYKFSNGCRLFFSGLNIYGLQKNPNDIFEPYSLIIENQNNELTIDNSKGFLFGSIGGDYALLLDKNNGKVFVINKSSGKLEKNFDNFESMFEYFFNALYDEYDVNCKKKHINKEFSKFPSLAHAIIELP